MLKLGQIVVTPTALKNLEAVGINPYLLLGRHMQGDWGDVCDDDWNANEDALKFGARIFSVYIYKEEKFYVITEADRSSTAILLPEEY